MHGQYKVVVLRSPYDTLEDEKTQNLFSKVAALKIRGYRQEYPYGILPFDVSDFVATHLLMCTHKNGELNPIMGFKSITLEKANIHRIPFPIYTIMKNSKLSHHEEVVNEIVDDYTKKHITNQIGYNGSWTVDPEIRKDKEEMKDIWNASVAILHHYYLQEGIRHIFAIASTKFKVDKIKMKTGWTRLNWNNEALEPFNCHALYDGEFALMHLTEFSPFSYENAQNFQSLWDDRLVIESSEVEKIRKAA